MELSKLTSVVIMLIAIGILVGIAINLSGELGNAARVEKGVVNESVAVVNRSNVALANGNLTSFFSLINTSGSELSTAEYTVYTENGSITFNIVAGNSTCGWGKSCNAIYDFYDYNTQTATAMSSVSGELGGITSNWLSIVIVVVIASIVLGLVFSSFQQRR